MPVEINISDEDIAFAERTILPEGKTFDQERRVFIRNLSTIDLQAVPGSGKTTALLAKLLILERNLPFQDGSGILVLSHTNAAIDEIKDKIEKHCPKLFRYPNFLGTIQGFVDEYLASPYYSSKRNKKIVRIDNEIYEENAGKYSTKFLTGFTPQEQNNAKRYLLVNDLYKKFRYSYVNNAMVLTNELNGKALDFKKPRGNTLPQNYSDWTDAEKVKVKEWVVKFKTNLLYSGCICYDDAYLLGELYLRDYPRIIRLLQKRFKYVFVDEMQDMDKHQYDLLEKIFFNNGNSVSNFQRIGDKNQAIYNGSIKVDATWSDRATVLTLNGSHRLTPPIADVVNCFALHRSAGFKVDGLREGTLKPHVILYNDATKEFVITEFAKRIKLYQASGDIPIDSQHKYKVLAWRKDHEDVTKFSLKTFYPQFHTEEHKPKPDYLSLKSYLIHYDKSKKTFEPIRKNILNAILRILRYEEILDEQGRYYTKRKLLSFLSDLDNANGSNNYDTLNLNLYKWSVSVVKNSVDPVLIKIRAYIPTFLSIFGKAIDKSTEFLNSDVIIDVQENIEAPRASNKLTHDGVEIEVTTVHSAKGQTHAATLYLETFYEGKYEPERLAPQIKGVNFNGTQKYQKQATIMSYVGLSRSTHLLCLAVHRDRFNTHLNDIDTQKWEVIEVQNN